MARKTAPFARIALDYPDHPKIAALSDGAFRAHVEMILYARRYMTDGRIPNRFANRFGSDSLTELETNDETNPSLVRDESGDYWLHDFLTWQESKSEIDARSQVNKANGSRGGRPKNPTGNRIGNRIGNRTAKRTESEQKAETETEVETERKEEQPSSPAAPATVREVDPYLFTEFWEQYPRKVGKDAARTAWARAVRKTHPDNIIKAAGRMARDPNLPDQQYIPHPTTWLNRGGWDDAPFPPRGRDRPSGRPTTDDKVRDGLDLARRLAEREQQQADRKEITA